MRTLENAIDFLVHQRCSTVIAGEGTGSILNIGFGELLDRQHRNNNPVLSSIDRKHEAPYSLMVWCSWRLNLENETICTSRDDNSNDGLLVQGVLKLKEKKTVNYRLSDGARDLRLEFDDRLSLDVFCDASAEDPDSENYSVFVSDFICSVLPHGRIAIEER